MNVPLADAAIKADFKVMKSLLENGADEILKTDMVNVLFYFLFIKAKENCK